MGRIDLGKFEGITRLAMESIEKRLISLEKTKPQPPVRNIPPKFDADAIFKELSPKFYDLMLAKSPWLIDRMNTAIGLIDYFYLPGRSGGQTAIGGTGAGDDLTLQTTSHATKGDYILSELTTAGFVKNTAAGVISGGNMITKGFVLTEFNDTDTLTAAHEIAICNKGSAMTLNLPAATGSKKMYFVKNIGVGVATLEGDGAETIDGAGNQALNQWDALIVVDYAAGIWIIL